MSIETINDQEFGLLEWDAELDEWTGQAIMDDGTPFDLSISTPDDQLPVIVNRTPDKTITAESRMAFRSLRRGDAHIRSKVADEMLAQYSEWHDGETISSEDFQRRLKLHGLRIHSDGSAKFFYLDDGMFFDHSLIAHLKSDGTVWHVEMFG